LKSSLEADGRTQWLLESNAGSDPLHLFGRWWSAAHSANLREPAAAALATADSLGRPSARMVLVRGFDERGFVFFTNLCSRKARELAVNPCAALVLYWAELERQVRIEGRVRETSAAESDHYFAGRPRESQLSAWASPQSEVLASREELEARYQEVSRQYSNMAVPRPPFWGGFRLEPAVIEFWQGGPHRLHDRLRYVRSSPDSWQMERLAP
jgi:pyridoxamine 5'-phosphate oxidase